MATGRVILVGAGPGDPGLLTLRGAEWLRQAEVVVVDRLVDPQVVALAPPTAEVVDVGKQPQRHPVPQEQINALLVDHARQGKLVVRLKGGDPFVFGRGGEEAEALVAAGIPFEVVPGVTAGIAGPAYAGIPVTHRDLASSVALITGHEQPRKDTVAVDLAALARGAQTLVFYMGVGHLEELAAGLVAHGRPPGCPAALVERATTPRQRIVTATLGTLAEAASEAGVRPPAIIVIGDVVRLREQLRWFDTGPLFGKRVLVTRARAQASVLSRLLRVAGAEPIEVPLIRIEPPESFAPLDEAIARLPDYDWVIFTSANGVEAFAARLRQAGLDARALGRAQLATVGPATAQALAAGGLRADVVAEDAQQAGLLQALADTAVAGQRFLLPRAAEAPDLLPQGLRERGATVDVVAAYRTVAGEGTAGQLRNLLAGADAAGAEGRPVDAVTFASSSTVSHFAELLGPEAASLASRAVVACIGPVTAATARGCGLRVDVEAGEHTIPGLVHALAEHFARG